MDMSAFRKHLENVHDKLNHPQASAMYEEKKPAQSLESTIRGVSNLMEADKKTAGKYGFTPNEKRDDTSKTKVNKAVEVPEDAAGAAAAGGKKKKIAEDILGGYLNDYFGGAVTEDTSEDDIMEAITNLFEMEAVVLEFLENDSAEDAVTEAVDAYLNEYFGGELTEDTSDEELSEAIADLLSTADAVRIALG